MDFDDASTLAFLCQAHKQGRIELRAVTVVNNGIGTAGRSLTHARTILEKCGLPRVPVADGSPHGVNPAPPEAREIFEHALTGALSNGDRPDQPATMTAAQLIAKSVLESREPVAVLPTGPLTNVATALRDHPELARRIASLSVMGGAYESRAISSFRPPAGSTTRRRSISGSTRTPPMPCSGRCPPAGSGSSRWTPRTM